MRNQVRPIRRLAAAVDSFGKGRDVPDFKPEGATEIRRAAGDKCARCWHYTGDIGCDAAWPGICARCVGHVRVVESRGTK